MPCRSTRANRRASQLTTCHETELIFETIGWPIGSGHRTPTEGEVRRATEYLFKSRVGLLFLEECRARSVELDPSAAELYRSLVHRRAATDEVVVRLTKRLDEVARDEWVLFKSIKPFLSTPNDTDWFPLDRRRHHELCEHLMADGQFKLLEKAPRQTTLIEATGESVTDTTKRGGVFYIDCYVFPSTDYFLYLDPRRLSGEVRCATVNGHRVPVLSPSAELAATMFHNVFPERSFSPESFYLIRSYLAELDETGTLPDFIALCHDQHMELAAAVNLSLVRAVDRAYFGDADHLPGEVMNMLGYADLEVGGFDPRGRFPYAIPNKLFWRCFAQKQRDGASFRSSLVQMGHMLNPVFAADVLKIIWRRCVRGGVYEQN